MRTVQSKQGDTVDIICLRYFGFTGGVTEQVMALNPHLTQFDLVLPKQVAILLPTAPSQHQQQVIQLWT